MRNLPRSKTKTPAGTTALNRPSGANSRHRIVPYFAWIAPLFLIAPGTVAGQGVCDRTPQVRDTLVEVTEVSGCGGVTAAHLSAVTTLWLGGEGIDALQAHDFNGLVNLEKLWLSANTLTRLPERVFSGLGSLQELHLDRNHLTTLPEGVFSELSSLKQLWLYDNALTTLPVGVFRGLSELQSIDLQYNTLTSLPAGVFIGLNNLVGLQLQNNALASLPAGVFTGLSDLEGLFLFNNSLTTLPAGVFSGLNNLKHLLLDGNPFTTLPPGVFSGLSSLQRLSLDNNTLTTLPKGVFVGLSSLPSLRLEVPSLSSLPVGAFSGLSSLEDLALVNTSLTTLPAGVFSGLGSLNRLVLNNNSLTSLPAGVFSGLSSLTRLNLSFNSLTTLPVGIFSGLSNLKWLYLSNNSLTTLPPGVFSGLSSLQSLTLRDNSLTTLPAEVFSRMNNLTYLPLSNNALTSLPVRAFIGLTYLETLSLHDNALTTLPAGIFNGLNNLRDLTLHNNALISLHTGAFSELSSLLSLTLSNNALTRLPAGAFSGLRSLIALWLNDNKLNQLPADLFSGLSSLYTLALHENSLTTLPVGIFGGLSSLLSLSLRNNALTTLPAGVFAGLERLGLLELNNNSLTTLPPGIFSGLRQLRSLSLQKNRLEILSAGLFSELDRLAILKLNYNRLRGLPSGIFDDVLDTLGDYFGALDDAKKGELSLDHDLKAMLSFKPTEQRASGGTVVKVNVIPSRPLPVAVRIPYSVGGSATADDYKDLSPSPSEGLLFLGGETSKEIVFSLLENKSSQGKTVTLTLGELSEIGLLRSDGTGPEAPHLKAKTFLKPPYHHLPQTVTHTVTIVSPGSTPDDPAPAPGRGIFVPVILSSAGLNDSFFTSELTLTNRSSEPAVLHYTYTAHRGEGSGTATDSLAPGRQRIELDAIDYLKRLGIPIPGSGKRIGTLRVEEVSGSSEVGVMVRTSTTVPEGRAGLAYPGISGDEGFQDEAVYLCGLRQNQQDRSNLAFQNMGAEGSITVRTTVFSGDVADTSPRMLKDVELKPGEFHQYTEVLKVLGSTANGYVKVERVEGTAPFYAYGVINDQANSDGSFVFPVSESSLAGTTGQTLPVVVERAPFTSELTVTNFSNEEKAVTFSVVSAAIQTEDHTATFPLQLRAGEQHIIPNVIDRARQLTAGIDLPGGLASPLFAEVENGDMSGIVIGARTGSQGSVGRYGVFYNAVPFGQSFTEVAWVDALQQNEENRSNLALVNTGEVDDSPSEFNLEIYNGETGLLVNTATGFRVAARHWYQIDGILDKYGMGTTQGYVRISKISGNNPFLAYGVINDGGTRLERSDDGAYLPARE